MSERFHQIRDAQLQRILDEEGQARRVARLKQNILFGLTVLCGVVATAALVAYVVMIRA